MIYASDALNAPKTLSKKGDNSTSSQSKEVNPMVEKLKTIKIVNVENAQNIGFYNLPLEEREKFINYLLSDEARELSKKIQKAPQLEEYIRSLNESLNEVVAEYDLTEMIVNIDETIEKKLSKRGLQIKKVNPSILFKRIDEKLKRKQEKQLSARPPEIYSISGTYSFDYPVVPPEKVRDFWSKYSQRGDFVVALPNMYVPFAYFNAGKNVRFKVCSSN